MGVSCGLAGTGEITAWLIDEVDPDKACTMLENLIKTKNIVPNEYTYATIKYDTSRTLNHDPISEDHFALRFGSLKSSPMIFVAQVTAGYDGTGPNCAKKCIEMMGFVLSKDEEDKIYSQPSEENGPIINLTFYKEND